jgi:hypothetical protein
VYSDRPTIVIFVSPGMTVSIIFVSPGMTVRKCWVLLPRFRTTRLAVAHQAIEMQPDVGGFRRGIGERDGAVEGDAGLIVAAELHQERAAHAEEVKIVG